MQQSLLATKSNALKGILATSADPTALVARLALGIMIFPHGAQKLLGWFGGFGFSGTMENMSKGIPAPLVLLAIIAEFFGGLGLITGTFSRVAAFGVGFTMLVASTKHIGNGFFMNWMGNQPGEGIEFHLLAIALAIVVMVKGGGLFSVDRTIAKSN